MWRRVRREETLFAPELAADGGEGVGESRLPLEAPGGCTAPGFLDNRFSYAARLKVWSCQAARMASGLRWPFFSISHSAL